MSVNWDSSLPDKRSPNPTQFMDPWQTQTKFSLMMNLVGKFLRKTTFLEHAF